MDCGRRDGEFPKGRTADEVGDSPEGIGQGDEEFGHSVLRSRRAAFRARRATRWRIRRTGARKAVLRPGSPPLSAGWLGRLDSNQNRGIQNPSCYRYTTAQNASERESILGVLIVLFWQYDVLRRRDRHDGQNPGHADQATEGSTPRQAEGGLVPRDLYSGTPGTIFSGNARQPADRFGLRQSQRSKKGET